MAKSSRRAPSSAAATPSRGDAARAERDAADAAAVAAAAKDAAAFGSLELSEAERAVVTAADFDDALACFASNEIFRMSYADANVGGGVGGGDGGVGVDDRDFPAAFADVLVRGVGEACELSELAPPPPGEGAGARLKEGGVEPRARASGSGMSAGSGQTALCGDAMRGSAGRAERGMLEEERRGRAPGRAFDDYFFDDDAAGLGGGGGGIGPGGDSIPVLASTMVYSAHPIPRGASLRYEHYDERYDPYLRAPPPPPAAPAAFRDDRRSLEVATTPAAGAARRGCDANNANANKRGRACGSINGLPGRETKRPKSGSARSTSRFRGVTHHCRTGRWEAHIWEDGARVLCAASRRTISLTPPSVVSRALTC